MAILSKWTCRFNKIATKIPVQFFTTEIQQTQNNQNNLENKNKFEVLIHPDFKTN